MFFYKQNITSVKHWITAVWDTTAGSCCHVIYKLIIIASGCTKTQVELFVRPHAYLLLGISKLKGTPVHKLHAMKMYRELGCRDVCILDLGSRWMKISYLTCFCLGTGILI